jgi:16S rRNA (guanine527-N7)-methyltransferase
MKVIDIGTGGGFPGIPLSIMFPEVQFTLCDSIAKKIRAVQDVIDRLELKNATALNSRTEQLSGKYDLATARAVAPMIDLWNWMKGKWAANPRFCLLKGGDLASEMNDLLMVQKSLKIRSSSIADFYIEPFFETKKVISID